MLNYHLGLSSNGRGESKDQDDQLAFQQDQMINDFVEQDLKQEQKMNSIDETE